jgi:tetratricopeptide (TPR) repeat protein
VDKDLPGSVDVKALLSEAARLERLGSVAEAVLKYERLLALKPDLPDSWFNLAILYRRMRRYKDALAAYGKALAHGIARPEEAHVNRSVIYADFLQDPEMAERELHAAIRANPGFVPALMNLANLFEDHGRRDEALATYEKVLDIDPKSFEALARYGHASRITSGDDPVIARLKRAMSDPDATPADRASLGFALGGALDACGEYEQAFAAYTTANRLSRQSAPPGFAVYEGNSHERHVDDIIRAFPASVPEAVTQGPASRPIFICGMFRSGSTLVESVLARHSRVTSGGELPFIPTLVRQCLSPFPGVIPSVSADTFGTLAKFYLDALDQMFPGSSRVTDKRLDNFLYLGVIKKLFPGARIIHACRDPLDTCLSVYFLHAAHSVNYGFDLMDIGHYYRQYSRLMRHWKSLYGSDIVEFDYDAYVHDPRPNTESLLQSLGLEWEDACLSPHRSTAAIKTASSWQVREPVYTSSSGRSRHYARQLEPLGAYLSGA